MYVCVSAFDMCMHTYIQTDRLTLLCTHMCTHYHMYLCVWLSDLRFSCIQCFFIKDEHYAAIVPDLHQQKFLSVRGTQAR